jgi:hypothetical protein
MNNPNPRVVFINKAIHIIKMSKESNLKKVIQTQDCLDMKKGMQIVIINL